MSKGVTFNDNHGPVTIFDESGSARPSILGKLIEIIATSDQSDINLDRDPAEIDVKVDFNDLTSHKWIIEEYIQSSLLIDESIEALNQTILNGSTKLKRQMKIFYNRALEKYSINIKPFDLEKLKSNSDQVVDEVILLTKRFVKNSSDLKNGYFEEDIDYGVSLITSYSIIECIVLENPNDHN
ncbi:hypothetical protein [Marinobacterium litorale]|uniref:hypothetical protein n=1 Tax=Marinobacterium litorale TaxID=404770 RepID=UPI00048846CA|nr:hypothetical protein [Marinobacterium litorale]